jgi:eukaryotic-like serine/threonine-protein kinase
MRPSVPSASSVPFEGMVIASEVHSDVRYRLERALGRGGTAVAYFATRLSAEGESPAVVKVILPRIVADSGDTALTIVKKEAVALGRLNEVVPPTPYVVRLMDVGQLPFEYFAKRLNLPWIALEYVHGGVEGTTLEQRVDYAVRSTGYAFDPERAARVIQSLSKGLAEIHAVGVVHRDLTPGNVLCCGSGDSELYKISDFGIARPAGLAATFGDAMVGTPGYVAPEQLGGNAPVSPQSDIFSFAAIVFFILTGQRYFDVASPTQALVAVGTPMRKSVLESATLSPELREREAACQAIDLALARATAPNSSERPKSATLFAQSLLPWIATESSPGRPSRRWCKSMEMLALEPEAAPDNAWGVRHPPGGNRLLTSVAWNGGGHCLAASTQGLCYWDGTSWVNVPMRGFDESFGDVRFVRRLTPTSWLVGGSNGALAEYSREGIRELMRLPDPSLRPLDAHGDLGDLAVVAVDQPGAGPALIGVAARRPMRPVPVTGAAMVSAIARIDDLRWLVVGRTPDSRAYAAIFRPLDFVIEPIQAPKGRALLAAASRPERRLALGVGSDGGIVRIERDRVETFNVEGRPDFASAAIDVLGNEWAAGAGCIWANRVRRGWKRVWENASWAPPFISLMAEAGLLVAVTVDSGVLECRSVALDQTKPG